jgi:hypothetical protein
MSWIVRRRSWRTSSWICVNSFKSCAARGSPCVFVIVNWRAISLEPRMPLKHPRTIQALVPEGLLNHCEGLRSTFPKIDTKFDTHSLFLSRIHRENRNRSRTWLQINACKNCALPPSYVQLGTLTHYTWESYHLPAIRAITTAVEVAAPVSKILDIGSNVSSLNCSSSEAFGILYKLLYLDSGVFFRVFRTGKKFVTIIYIDHAYILIWDLAIYMV